MTDLEELRRKAEAATKGPWVRWKSQAGRWVISRFQPEYGEGNEDMMATVAAASGDGANAEFIAAMDPATVLAMVRVCEAAADSTTSIEAYVAGTKPEAEWDEYDHMMIPKWRALRAALEALGGLGGEK